MLDNPSSAVRNLLRWTRPLTLAWTAAFTCGLCVLALVAVRLESQRHRSDLDADLALYAMATYGLTWFDERGAFHGEVFEREEELRASEYEIWVIEPGNPPITHLQPEDPFFEIPDLALLSQDMVDAPREVFREGVDRHGQRFRLHAIPTFAEGDDEEAVAMIAVLGDPEPGRLAHRLFVLRIVAITAFLAFIGLLVGIVLARWSLRPALVSLRRREGFIAATAHELRNPLAALRGVCDGGLSGDEQPEKALERMSKILDASSRTVEDLLLFTRLDVGTVEPAREKVRLDLLVETVLPEDGSIRLAAEPCVVEIDPSLAAAAVRNLVENACLHGRSGDRESGDGVRVTVRRGEIVVEDQGPGFPADLLARQVHEIEVVASRRGSGLGLAITQLIATLHEGELRLENQPSGGARTILHLVSAKFQVA